MKHPISPASLILDMFGACTDEAMMDSQYTQAVNERNQMKVINNKYKARFYEIESFTRKDLFENFKSCANLAKLVNDFMFLQDPIFKNNIDIDSFINSVFTIINPSEIIIS